MIPHAKSLTGFIVGSFLTLTLIITTAFMTGVALNTCILHQGGPGTQEKILAAVPDQSQPVLKDLLVVQANYICPSESRPRFSNRGIEKRFKSNKGGVVEAQNEHYGPAAGTFYNFRLVHFMYKGVITLGIIADFSPNKEFINSGLYARVKKYYDSDNSVGVQLSILDHGTRRSFGHVAFVKKGAATNDFRLTDKEIIKIIE